VWGEGKGLEGRGERCGCPARFVASGVLCWVGMWELREEGEMGARRRWVRAAGRAGWADKGILNMSLSQRAEGWGLARWHSRWRWVVRRCTGRCT
jgi:hypothetical protein